MMAATDMAQPGDISHPIVGRIWNRLSHTLEQKGAAEHRRELLAGLSGRVIEVGAGNGINFAHYPSSVSEVVAIEPEPFLRRRAEEAARSAPVAVRVTPGVADRLGDADGSYDASVTSLVLCTVPDVSLTLAELFRVIRPGGELRFYEHVRSDRPGFARFQQVFDVAWVRLNGWGCHASRDTPTAIARAGFVIESTRRFTFHPTLFEVALSPHVIGVARRP
jgi:ubiquinone/menaquinone biosynthesis C-methylase UbiE